MLFLLIFTHKITYYNNNNNNINNNNNNNNDNNNNGNNNTQIAAIIYTIITRILNMSEKYEVIMKNGR